MWAARPCSGVGLPLNFPWVFVQAAPRPIGAVAVPDDNRCAIKGLAELTYGLWSAEVQFLFGDCVLDADRRELTRASEVIATGPQVFDLLIYLIQNRERVVSKDDVLDSVWSGRTVSESPLTSHINAVR